MDCDDGWLIFCLRAASQERCWAAARLLVLLGAEEMLSSAACICLAQSIVAFSLQFRYYSRVSSQNSKINRLQIKINRNTASKLAWMILCCYLICQETARADPCLKMYCCSLIQSLVLSLFFFFFFSFLSSPFLATLFCLLQVHSKAESQSGLVCAWSVRIGLSLS